MQPRRDSWGRWGEKMGGKREKMGSGKSDWREKGYG